MEYRIGRQLFDRDSGGSKIEMHNDLTEKEFRDLQNALSKLEELHAVRRLRDFVVANDDEMIAMLNASLSDLVNKAGFWADVKRKDIEKVFLNANRLLLNYLSSVKTFIDHTTTFLDRRFGKQSEQFIGFKTMLSAFFDQCFAYRFFSKLRDYAQHVDLPLHGITFKSNRDQEINRITGELTVAFNRDSLLNTFKKWGPVRSDLEQMDESFYFTSLLFQMTQIISEIERNVELIFKDELIPAANLISDYISELRNDGWEIFLAYDFRLDNDGHLKNFQQSWIPLDTIDFILTSLSDE